MNDFLHTVQICTKNRLMYIHFDVDLFTGKFIPQCLEKAGRPELMKKFQSLLSASAKGSSGSARSRSRQRSKSLERKDDAGITIDQDRVKTMADQIDKMYNTIVSAHESVSTSYTFPTKSYSSIPVF